jgi:tetratricopeptide (TPR) repeat protein
MRTIIQFLKNKIESESEQFEINGSTDKDIESLNLLFLNKDNDFNNLKKLEIKPPIEKNQIWTLKTEYVDKLGDLQKESHPFLVFINSDLKKVEGCDVTRVLIVTPFIEMATPSDEVCDDPTIIGFPFLIETWNDQPMLTELLNEYVGSYNTAKYNKSEIFEGENNENITKPKFDNERISDEQKEFRKVEISRAKYINHSVLALFRYLENQQNDKQDKIVEKPSGKGKIIRMIITIGSVAAIFVFIFNIWIRSNKNEEIKFVEFEKSAKVLLASIEPSKEKIDSSSNSRGNEVIYEGFTQFETQKIITAKAKALEGNYIEAINELEKLENLEKNKEISLMLSLIYLNAGNYENSIKTLKDLEINQKSDLTDDAIIYYLGLSYALNGENEKAKKQLGKLQNTSSRYKSLANYLIKNYNL